MGNWLKCVIAFASAFALMLAFRTLVFSVHSVSGDGLAPLYQNGDRLLINSCWLTVVATDCVLQETDCYPTAVCFDNP